MLTPADVRRSFKLPLWLWREWRLSQTRRGHVDHRWQVAVCEGGSVGKPGAGALYAVVMAAIIVGVDVAFFRGRFWERLAANVGIVLVFGAFYFRFLHHA